LTQTSANCHRGIRSRHHFMTDHVRGLSSCHPPFPRRDCLLYVQTGHERMRDRPLPAFATRAQLFPKRCGCCDVRSSGSEPVPSLLQTEGEANIVCYYFRIQRVFNRGTSPMRIMSNPNRGRGRLGGDAWRNNPSTDRPLNGNSTSSAPSQGVKPSEGISPENSQGEGCPAARDDGGRHGEGSRGGSVPKGGSSPRGICWRSETRGVSSPTLAVMVGNGFRGRARGTATATATASS